MPKVISATTEIPEALRPYHFHGIRFDKEERGESFADCPACGRGGKKFSVKSDTGEYKCFVCGFAGGGSTMFLRWLWEESDRRTNGESKVYAAERGLLYEETLTYWGFCVSVISGSWLVPGYSPDGGLVQLYRRIKAEERWEFRPTPDVGGHAIHGLPLFNDESDTVFICEKPSDAMALWEMLRTTKQGAGGLEFTGNPGGSLLSQCSVLAVANCGAVGESFTRYMPRVKGKRVVLCFDNDHPRDNAGTIVDGAGFGATKRAIAMLYGMAREICWLKWADVGWDANRPSGYDVRDLLTDARTPQERIGKLAELFQQISSVPAEWVEEAKAQLKRQKKIQPIACKSWPEVLGAWHDAAVMRQNLTDVLLVMLAVALSTEQEGDQLFLQVVGVPGTMKTTFCDAMLVSESCYPLEHLTGFHSGSMDATGDDFSLIARIDRKTMITPEGDILMSSPIFDSIMAQQRRIFDGASGATYKNRKTDMRYQGLRTPWIMAATPAIIEKKDQTQLGDRFIRVNVDKATTSQEREILRHVVRSAISSVRRTSNCSPETQLSPQKARAYQLTGGYIDYFREYAERLLNLVNIESAEIQEQYMDLGELTAYLRAKPPDKVKSDDLEAAKELPSRLTHQYARLGVCLAAVMQKPFVDTEVIRIVRKVAVDTSRARMLRLVGLIHDECERNDSCYTTSLARWTGCTDEKMHDHLKFLLDIGVVEHYQSQGPGADALYRWVLTQRMKELWQQVHRF